MISPVDDLAVATAIAMTLAAVIIIVVAGWRGHRRATCAPAARPDRRHVYVIAHRGKRGRAVGPTKIGIAKNPGQRLKTFQTANPRPLMLYRTYRVSHARFLERAVHRRLHSHRLKGEWFALPPERAAQAVRQTIARPRAALLRPPKRFSIRAALR